MSTPGTRPPNVAIAVLNWENYLATLRCLDSLALLDNQERVRIDVLVCDNGSSNESLEHLSLAVDQSEIANVRLISNDQNLGFAGGMNRCIDELCRSSTRYDYIWLLNSDVTVRADTLSSLISDASNDRSVKLWGCTVLERELGRVQYAGGGRYIPWLSLQTANGSGRQLEEVLRESYRNRLDYVAGCSMFFDAGSLQSGLRLNSDYFLYYEELDLTNRLGGSSMIAWSPGSIVWHDGGGSLDALEKEGASIAQYHENLSTLIFTGQHYPRYLPLVFLIRLSVKPILFILRGQTYLMRPFWRALVQYIARSRAGQ